MLYGISNRIRAGIATFGFFGAIALSPWVPLLAMIALSLRFRAWEVVALGALVDFLWFTPFGSDGFFSSLPLFTLIGFGLVSFLEPFRSELLS